MVRGSGRQSVNTERHIGPYRGIRRCRRCPDQRIAVIKGHLCYRAAHFRSIGRQRDRSGWTVTGAVGRSRQKYTRHRVEQLLWNDCAGRTRRHIPIKASGRRVGFAIILHLQGVFFARGQNDLRAVIPQFCRVVIPVVDHQHTVHPQPDSVARPRGKAIGSALRCEDLSGPTHAVSPSTDRCGRRRRAPVETHACIKAGSLQRGEIHVVVIESLQSGATGPHHDVDRPGR